MQLYSFSDLVVSVGGWSKPSPRRFQPWLGGLQGRSGRAKKMSLLPGYEPRAFEPVAIRYTDYAIH
jgi:hypothetical protein